MAHIDSFVWQGHHVRIANDPDRNGDYWKTSVDHDIWTVGMPTVGEAVFLLLQQLKELEAAHV